jgi:23S rRNA U2552 (ribose-2'-O)-methylase RlmE/FtsJ
MAPGGYTDIFLKIHPEASVKGITLPPHLGGHPMCIPHSDKDPRVQVEFMDLTMLAVEYGTSMAEIPKEHPDAKNFSGDRPFLDETFDLVICDGQILRTHFREDYRQTREALRLNVAQLIFGMTRIKQGGTFVMLLHKADAFDNIELLETFDTFSKVKLVKPKKAHAPRSSFYLVAKDVDPTHHKAQYAIEQWKKDWKRATLGGDGGAGMNKEMATEIKVNAVLEEFGPRLIKLAKDIWDTQKNALERASYTKPNSPRMPTLQRKPQDENAALGSWRKTAHSNMDSPKAKLESVEKTPNSPNVSRKW